MRGIFFANPLQSQRLVGCFVIMESETHDQSGENHPAECRQQPCGADAQPQKEDHYANFPVQTLHRV